MNAGDRPIAHVHQPLDIGRCVVVGLGVLREVATPQGPPGRPEIDALADVSRAVLDGRFQTFDGVGGKDHADIFGRPQSVHLVQQVAQR